VHSNAPEGRAAQRQLCRYCDRRTPNEPVSVADLRRLGVLSWHLNSGDGLEDDPQLAAIRKARGYSYQVLANASMHQSRGYGQSIRRHCARRPQHRSQVSGSDPMLAASNGSCCCLPWPGASEPEAGL
jgi:hypothetical protein